MADRSATESAFPSVWRPTVTTPAATLDWALPMAVSAGAVAVAIARGFGADWPLAMIGGIGLFSAVLSAALWRLIALDRPQLARELAGVRVELVRQEEDATALRRQATELAILVEAALYHGRLGDAAALRSAPQRDGAPAPAASPDGAPRAPEEGPFLQQADDEARLGPLAATLVAAATEVRKTAYRLAALEEERTRALSNASPRRRNIRETRVWGDRSAARAGQIRAATGLRRTEVDLGPASGPARPAPPSSFAAARTRSPSDPLEACGRHADDDAVEAARAAPPKPSTRDRSDDRLAKKTPVEDQGAPAAAAAAAQDGETTETAVTPDGGMASPTSTKAPDVSPAPRPGGLENGAGQGASADDEGAVRPPEPQDGETGAAASPEDGLKAERNASPAASPTADQSPSARRRAEAEAALETAKRLFASTPGLAPAQARAPEEEEDALENDPLALAQEDAEGGARAASDGEGSTSAQPNGRSTPGLLLRPVVDPESGRIAWTEAVADAPGLGGGDPAAQLIAAVDRARLRLGAPRESAWSGFEAAAWGRGPLRVVCAPSMSALRDIDALDRIDGAQNAWRAPVDPAIRPVIEIRQADLGPLDQGAADTEALCRLAAAGVSTVLRDVTDWTLDAERVAALRVSALKTPLPVFLERVAAVGASAENLHRALHALGLALVVTGADAPSDRARAAAAGVRLFERAVAPAAARPSAGRRPVERFRQDAPHA